MESRYMLPNFSNGCGIPSTPESWGEPRLFDCGGKILAVFDNGIAFKYAVRCQDGSWWLEITRVGETEQELHPASQRRGYFRGVDFEGRSSLRYWCVEKHITPSA